MSKWYIGGIAGTLGNPCGKDKREQKFLFFAELKMRDKQGKYIYIYNVKKTISISVALRVVLLKLSSDLARSVPTSSPGLFSHLQGKSPGNEVGSVLHRYTHVRTSLTRKF